MHPACCTPVSKLLYMLCLSNVTQEVKLTALPVHGVSCIAHLDLTEWMPVGSSSNSRHRTCEAFRDGPADACVHLQSSPPSHTRNTNIPPSRGFHMSTSARALARESRTASRNEAMGMFVSLRAISCHVCCAGWLPRRRSGANHVLAHSSRGANSSKKALTTCWKLQTTQTRSLNQEGFEFLTDGMDMGGIVAPLGEARRVTSY